MSVYCRVANPILLLQALGTLSLDKDSWATITFAEHAVELHVEANNRNTTATAILPRSLFAEYVVVETRLCVHLPTLLDTFFLFGQQALTSPTVRLSLVHPTSDGRLFVELAERAGGCGRTLQAHLATRPLRARPLDLRFPDFPLAEQAGLPAEALRDALQDLSSAQCAETTLGISAAYGVRLRGRGPYGEVEVVLRPHAAEGGAPVEKEGRGGPREASLSSSSSSSESSSSAGWTRVQTQQLALACGCGRSTSSLGGAGGGGGASGSFASPTSYAGGAGLVGGGGAGFEHLTLQINSQRQLSVVHTSSEENTKVTVRVVLNSLHNFDEL